MALTIKHLNGDASFLLSFEPTSTPSQYGSKSPCTSVPPFRILLDPWITGPSTIFHSKISTTRHKKPACIESLQELPEPDLVVISQHKSDHCNEATLRQLPPSGTKTLIIAEPASARVVRSWKYFDRDKIRAVPKWDDSSPRLGGNGSRQAAERGIFRIPVPPVVPGGEPGEVTVAFIPQRRDISGLHSAVGITYRPPSLSAKPPPPAAAVFTPPATPVSYKSHRLQPMLRRHASSPLRPEPEQPPLQTFPPVAASPTSAEPRHLGAPPTPTSPSLLSLRSVRSVSSLAISSRRLSRLSTATTQVSSSASSSHTATTTAAATTTNTTTTQTTLSILFSPHGISYPSLSSYVDSHLVPEAALPLTALLHCFDAVSNPWWLGGNILLGAPAGLRTAAALGARAWISAHDGEKDVRGLATALLRTRRYRREEVVQAVVRPPPSPSAVVVVKPPPGGTIAEGGSGNHHLGDDDCVVPPAAIATAAGGAVLGASVLLEPPRLPASVAAAGVISSASSCRSSVYSVASSSAESGMGMRKAKAAAAAAAAAAQHRPTEVLSLGIGEQVVLGREGVWSPDTTTTDEGRSSSWFAAAGDWPLRAECAETPTIEVGSWERGGGGEEDVRVAPPVGDILRMGVGEGQS